MSVPDHIADFLRRYKEEHHLSIAELSEELGIAKSATVNYLSGRCNPRANTMDLIAEKCGVSTEEMISAQSPGRDRAEIMERAARLFGDLPPERREKAVTHFLALVDVLSEGDHA